MQTRTGRGGAADPGVNRKRVAFVWDQFSPYHVDRCEHVAYTLRDRVEVIGLEFASRSNLYAWPEARKTQLYNHITLFPGKGFEETTWWNRLRLLTQVCLSSHINELFVAGYQRPEILFSSLLIRLFGGKVFVMSESKFDDKPRFWLKEIFKVCMLSTYNGGLAGGQRTADYLRFLGFRKRPIAAGYDSVSVDRVRSNAGQGGSRPVAFKDRYFVIVARFVEKKNLFTALDAYTAYAQSHGLEPRHLHLVGSGPLEPKIRDYIRTHNLKNVVLHGFLDDVGVASILKNALALMLPSLEEQWGLVINEALALNLPVLVSDNVGARDTLVRQGVNGFVIEPLNVAGWVWCMAQLCRSEELWLSMAAASSRLAPRGDVAEFAKGCAKLLGYIGGAADFRVQGSEGWT
jgi:glycosyltransferase involved in cell wall biosynthesis